MSSPMRLEAAGLRRDQADLDRAAGSAVGSVVAVRAARGDESGRTERGQQLERPPAIHLRHRVPSQKRCRANTAPRRSTWSATLRQWLVIIVQGPQHSEDRGARRRTPGRSARNARIRAVQQGRCRILRHGPPRRNPGSSPPAPADRPNREQLLSVFVSVPTSVGSAAAYRSGTSRRAAAEQRGDRARRPDPAGTPRPGRPPGRGRAPRPPSPGRWPPRTAPGGRRRSARPGSAAARLHPAGQRLGRQRRQRGHPGQDVGRGCPASHRPGCPVRRYSSCATG